MLILNIKKQLQKCQHLAFDSRYEKKNKIRGDDDTNDDNKRYKNMCGEWDVDESGNLYDQKNTVWLGNMPTLKLAKLSKNLYSAHI